MIIIKIFFIKNIKKNRNSLSTLLRQNKKQYCNNYFKNNINNIKNTWKGIENLNF